MSVSFSRRGEAKKEKGQLELPLLHWPLWQVLGQAVRTEDVELSCSNAVRSGHKRLCTLTACTVGEGAGGGLQEPVASLAW